MIFEGYLRLDWCTCSPNNDIKQPVSEIEVTSHVKANDSNSLHINALHTSLHTVSGDLPHNQPQGAYASQNIKVENSNVSNIPDYQVVRNEHVEHVPLQAISVNRPESIAHKRVLRSNKKTGKNYQK